MTKNEFINELSVRLSGLSDADLKSSLDYYGEMIDERIEEGTSEEIAVSMVGTPHQAAEAILNEMPLSKLIKTSIKPRRKLSALEIVLLVLGSPIWLSLLIAVIAVIISVYAVLWSVIVTLWSVELSIIATAAAALILFITSLVINGNIFTAIIWLGICAIAAALAIYFFFGCLYSTKGFFILSKKIFIFIKSWFIRKETVK